MLTIAKLYSRLLHLRVRVSEAKNLDAAWTTIERWEREIQLRQVAIDKLYSQLQASCECLVGNQLEIQRIAWVIKHARRHKDIPISTWMELYDRENGKNEYRVID